MSKFLRRPDARPEELLTAALARFRSAGFAATKVEDVAGDAGVTVGTVYRYFPGKEALFHALVQRSLDPSWSRGKEITEAYGTQTPREVVSLLLERLATWLDQPEPRDILLLVVREAAAFPSTIQEYVEQLLAKGCIAVERALRHGIDRGEFPLLPVELTARALVAGVLQQVIWDATFGERMGAPRDPKGQTALVIDLLVRGLPHANGAIASSASPLRESFLPIPGNTAEHPIPGRVRIVTLRPPSAD